MLAPLETGSGVSALVLARSACGEAYDVETVIWLFELLGSATALPTVKVWLMVWLDKPNCACPAFSTRVNGEVADAANVAAVQVNDAPWPTASAGQVQPEGTVIDWK